MKFYFTESLRLLFKTWPFWFLKIAIYWIIGLIFLLFAGIFIFLAAKFSGVITVVIVIIALLSLWGTVALVRHYILYLVKAGHVAVLGTLIRKGALPENVGMVQYGFNQVKSKFATSSAFFVVDNVIKVVVRGITNFIYRLGNLIPVASVQRLFSLLAHIVGVFFSYIDEAILSFVFTHPDDDVWKGSRDGLVLYFKSWKEMLGSSVVIVLLNYALSTSLFFIIYILTLPVLTFLPLFLRDVGFVIALVITLIVKFSFFNQWTLVWMVLAYQESIQGKTPDSATMNKLESLIPKFKEITAKSGKGISQQLKVAQGPEAADPNLSRLVSYVKAERMQGYTDEQIKTALLNTGWSEDLVAKAFQKG